MVNDRRSQTLGSWSVAIANSIKLNQVIVEKSNACKVACNWSHLFNTKKRRKCKSQCSSAHDANYATVECCKEYNIHTKFSPCPDGLNYFDPTILSEYGIPLDELVEPGTDPNAVKAESNNFTPILIAASILLMTQI